MRSWPNPRSSPPTSRQWSKSPNGFAVAAPPSRRLLRSALGARHRAVVERRERFVAPVNQSAAHVLAIAERREPVGEIGERAALGLQTLLDRRVSRQAFLEFGAVHAQ